jgi:dihydroorotate dehydrogenase (NAD+) catalytic subunit
LNTKPSDLSVKIGSMVLKNPVLLASGTCGYGAELSDFLNLEHLGGIIVKGISVNPRTGNPPPRLVETPCGLLNSIGLENIGMDAFLKDKLPWLRNIKTSLIVNILGNSIEEYTEIAKRLNKEKDIHAIEVNISCPNVKAGGIAFGTDPNAAAHVTLAVKKVTDLPVIIKLSPNVTDIISIARKVAYSGADAISLINTVLGMAIDIKSKRPALANIFGGLSGPAIKPIALRMVWQVVRNVDIPVIGIGGICNSNDAIEFLMAGAKAVEIGTATLVRPSNAEDVLFGIKQYMETNKIQNVEELRLPE